MRGWSVYRGYIIIVHSACERIGGELSLSLVPEAVRGRFWDFSEACRRICDINKRIMSDALDSTGIKLIRCMYVPRRTNCMVWYL